jgi:zinc transporter ZupT
MAASGTALALLATAVATGSAALGASSLIGSPRRIVPFSGGLLAGIAAFAVFPELAEQHTWGGAAALLAAGVALMWAFGRYVYPVCPSCSHTHDHAHCETTLHGFAFPLVAAASLHAFLDGLGIAASQQDTGGAGAVVLAGVLLHKVPEGIALGLMLRAAMKSRWAAFGWAAAAEAATFAGALLESMLTAGFGSSWVSYALALAGGSFLYLGFHAVHGDWRRRGAPAFMPALTGAAGAAALQHGLRLFLR